MVVAVAVGVVALVVVLLLMAGATLVVIIHASITSGSVTEFVW